MSKKKKEPGGISKEGSVALTAEKFKETLDNLREIIGSNTSDDHIHIDEAKIAKKLLEMEASGELDARIAELAEMAKTYFEKTNRELH